MHHSCSKGKLDDRTCIPDRLVFSLLAEHDDLWFHPLHLRPQNQTGSLQERPYPCPFLKCKNGEKKERKEGEKLSEGGVTLKSKKWCHLENRNSFPACYSAGKRKKRIAESDAESVAPPLLHCFHSSIPQLFQGDSPSPQPAESLIHVFPPTRFKLIHCVSLVLRISGRSCSYAKFCTASRGGGRISARKARAGGTFFSQNFDDVILG